MSIYLYHLLHNTTVLCWCGLSSVSGNFRKWVPLWWSQTLVPTLGHSDICTSYMQGSCKSEPFSLLHNVNSIKLHQMLFVLVLPPHTPPSGCSGLSFLLSKSFTYQPSIVNIHHATSKQTILSSYRYLTFACQ